MKLLSSLAVLVAVLSLTLPASTEAAEYHRATRLGNPATRFAPPLRTPEDLRARFADPKLRPDFVEVLRQWGWTGHVEDLFAAAAKAEIVEAPIAIGDVLPFMSTRENGRPICLRNVEWAGKEPAPAYAFNFTSNGRRYRCLTPKACSNFLVIDLGPEPRNGLTMACAMPDSVLLGRPIQVCLTVVNSGNVSESATTLVLPVPAGAAVTRITDGGTLADGRVTWQLPALAANTGKQVCATFASRQLGELAFTANARGASGVAAETACSTKLIGIPAILLEVVDLEDPIEVGKEATYEIRVTNQGSATGTNIRLTATLPASQSYVSGSGVTTLTEQERAVTFAPLAQLEPKAVATWRVVVKAAAADDARFKVELLSDQFTQPIVETESTQQY